MDSVRFKAVIFDMDGTLTVPTLDFQRIREEIGLPPGDVAHEIGKLGPAGQQRAWKIIEDHEEQAMQQQRPQQGCLELLRRCRERRIKQGVVTRNTQRSIDHFQQRYNLRFDGAISREFPFMKPHPEPILHLLRVWSAAPADALMVGDYLHDIECGLAAGTRTCFFQNVGKPSYADKADYAVASMAQLQNIIFGNEQA